MTAHDLHYFQHVGRHHIPIVTIYSAGYALTSVRQPRATFTGTTRGGHQLKFIFTTIAPMDGFETYVIAAIHAKNVKCRLVADKDKADYELAGTSDSETA